MKNHVLACFAFIAIAPTACDADGDGLRNRDEAAFNLNPENPDTDGDGLLDSVEISLGTDPLNPDSDGDHLLDGHELQFLANPLNPDTDGDTYLDGDEVLEGTNPTDPSSRIYTGRWPYQRDKDTFPHGPRLHRVEIGARFPRLQLVDQHGEVVDLYDFAHWEKDIIVNIAARNCSPNHGIADWLSGEASSSTYNEEQLRKAINRGDVYWLELIYSHYLPPTESTPAHASEWSDLTDNEKVPVLADEALEAWDFAYAGHTPTTLLLDQDMTVLDIDIGQVPLADLVVDRLW